MPKHIQHFIEYAGLRTLEFIMRALPRTAAIGLGSAIGRLLYISGIYRQIVKTSMMHTGVWNDSQISDITKKLYRNIGRYFADYLHASSKDDFPHTVSGETVVEDLRTQNKGIICVMAHFGAWEALAYMFDTARYPLGVVVMPMSNPRVEKWLAAKRKLSGMTLVYKHQAVREIVRKMRRNESVAILTDQNAAGRGPDIPFLGKDAPTYDTVPGLMRSLQCPYMYAYAILDNSNRYTIHFEKGRDLAISDVSPEEYIRSYLTEQNNVISGWIIKYPEHYFGWFHKRWSIEYPRP